jgi:hypothetical protein
MSYFTLANYQTVTGLTLAGVNSAYIDNKLNFWSSQINQLTGQSYNSGANISSVIKRFKKCHDWKMNIGGWQNTLANPLVVSVRTVGSTTWQTLVENKDFTFVYPQFNTFVGYSQVANPIVSLNFSCLSCRCKCEEIKLEGDKRWSNGLPDDLKNILIELTEILLKNDDNAYTSGQLPSKYLFQQVKSESDQTRSVSWQRDDKLQASNNQKLAQGVAYSEYQSVISKYLRYNFNLNASFNA